LVKDAHYFFELIDNEWAEKDYGHLARNIEPFLFFSVDKQKFMLGRKGKEVWIINLSKNSKVIYTGLFREEDHLYQAPDDKFYLS